MILSPKGRAGSSTGFEPVAMRYFRLDDNGELDYLDQAEIDALDSAKKASLKHDWESPTFSPAFANVEIQYRKIGETAVRTHRHIGWNLGDDYMTKHPQLVRHLAKKGQVTLLTKGASYLLWRGDFSIIFASGPSLRCPNQSGGPIEVANFWTASYVKEGGKWKIRMLSSIPKPPPAK